MEICWDWPAATKSFLEQCFGKSFWKHGVINWTNKMKIAVINSFQMDEFPIRIRNHKWPKTISRFSVSFTSARIECHLKILSEKTQSFHSRRQNTAFLWWIVEIFRIPQNGIIQAIKNPFTSIGFIGLEFKSK